MIDRLKSFGAQTGEVGDEAAAHKKTQIICFVLKLSFTKSHTYRMQVDDLSSAKVYSFSVQSYYLVRPLNMMANNCWYSQLMDLMDFLVSLAPF